jgi:hypothetical protein
MPHISLFHIIDDAKDIEEVSKTAQQMMSSSVEIPLEVNYLEQSIGMKDIYLI